MKVWIEYYKSGTAAFISSTKVKSKSGLAFGIGKNFTSISYFDQRDLKCLLDREGTLVDEAKESYLYEIDL